MILYGKYKSFAITKKFTKLFKLAFYKFNMENKDKKIRQPIVTVAGHVDHGKTSILDCFSSTSIQEQEAGGITQKISFTKFPYAQIKNACPIIEKKGIKIEIPGFLFIDTPGHAAFTNLRKRGGSLADLVILVVSIKEGIKPQTAEVLQILKMHKTPFLVALNKIDSISGWQTNLDNTLKESIEIQPINVRQQFEELLLTFQGALLSHGFESDLYFNVSDFAKKVAIVPCSAKTKEGISDLLLVLCGLSQKFLKDKLVIGKSAKGVILEIKKEKTLEYTEAILYDGILEEGDEIAIASFDDVVISKIRAIEEIEPLSRKYKNVKKVVAATGIRMHLADKENILPGMPFQKINNDLEKIKKDFKKEISQTIKLDQEGIIIKADSLGSLEALFILLKQENMRIVKAGIGKINKADIITAKANLELSPLNAVVLGFNVGVEEEISIGNVKLITNDVIYKLIEELEEWRNQRQKNIERERLMELATVCKLEILSQFLFRNSNPAIFGVRVFGGKLKLGMELINENNEKISSVRSMQHEKESIKEALEGQEIAISLPRVNFERKLKDTKFLYSEIMPNNFKKFKQNKDLLSFNELRILEEIAEIKRKKNYNWGK